MNKDKVIFEIDVVVASISDKDVVLTNAGLQKGYYGDWYFKLGDSLTLIESNEENTIVLKDLIESEYHTITDGRLVFIVRKDVSKYDDFISGVDAVPRKLFESKVELAYHEVNREVFASLRKLYNEDFNPIQMIKNVYVLRDAVAYKILELLFSDLSLAEDSFNEFKAIKYEKNYKKVLSDCVALLLVDKNEDGEIDAEEKKYPSSVIILDR